MNRNHVSRLAIWSAGMVCAVALAPAALVAQAVTFTGLRTTAINNYPAAVTGAVFDGYGNEYLTTMAPSQIVKIGASGSQSVAYSDSAADRAVGLSSAVDKAGNLYVADSGINEVLKIAPNGTQSVVASGLYWPDSVAVDGSGNVFIADSRNNRVVEAPSGGGSLIQVASLTNPRAVAVDSAGDLFIGDVAQITELPAGGGPQILVTTSIVELAGMAVDGQGDLFVTDNGSYQVVEERALGAGQYFQAVLDNPGEGVSGIGVDPAGNVYYPLAVSSNGNVSSLIELDLSAVNMGSANLCLNGPTPAPCSQMLPLTFAANQYNADLKVQVLSGGHVGGDFAPGSMSCQSTAPPQAPLTQCQVYVKFGPQFAGVRQGAIEITDASGDILATTYLYGIGNGPQITVLPPSPTTLYTSNGNVLDGIAADFSGNVYVADPENSRVLKIAPGGAATTFGSGWKTPFEVTLDGAGNVYVTDNSYLYKLNPAGQQLWKASGPIFAAGVAVTAQDTVWVTDLGSPTAYEFSSAGSPMLQIPLPAPVLGVAVDSNNTLYFTDGVNKQIDVLSPFGATLKTIPMPGLTILFDTVDPAGDLYVAATAGLFEIPANGPLAGMVVEIPSSPAPQAVAFDPSGDLFLSTGYSTVVEYPAMTSSLKFPILTPGSSATQSYLVQNFGNSTLTDSAMTLTSKGSYSQVAGSGAFADCTAGFSLAPGAICNLSIDFTPQTSGTINGWLQFTDNAGNVANASQILAVTGQGGPKLNQTISGFNLSGVTGAVGNTLTLSATSSSGLPVVFTSQTPAVCTIYVGQGYVDALMNAAGTCAIQAAQPGNVEYNPAKAVTQSFNVSSN
ncbi:MAG: hypothetical protein ABSE87_12495 [Terracidiphilus sp.]|jgi:sugar lactone lactonase YvrE